MKTRILVAAVGLPLLLVVVLALPAAATAVLVAAMCVLAVYELLDGAGYCKHVRIFAYSSCMAVMVCLWSLLELPRGITSHSAFLEAGCVEKFEASIQTLLQHYDGPNASRNAADYVGDELDGN